MFGTCYHDFDVSHARAEHGGGISNRDFITVKMDSTDRMVHIDTILRMRFFKPTAGAQSISPTPMFFPGQDVVCKHPGPIHPLYLTCTVKYYASHAKKQEQSSADNNDGAISTQGASPLSVSDSTFTNNTATYRGGGAIRSEKGSLG